MHNINITTFQSSSKKKMELELSRVDYTIVGITSQSCMKLLPNTKPNEQQKVAVADTDGILQVFSVKKEDIQLHFKTLPGPKITSLQLGGETGTPCDKIFISSENEVRGYTKKGKLFLSFDSNMTEPITSMFVLSNDLFLCGKHIYNHYKDCKDIGSYLCGDCIVDVVALPMERSHRLIALIACEGRMIRALEHARVTMSMEIESSPTVLHIYENNGNKHVLFGTVDGRVGILDVERKQSFSRWFLHNDRFSSSISCIESYNMMENENKNLIIGRQDGSIEVYVVNIENDMDIPKLVYFMNCNESVTALQCGVVGNQGYDEILVATYTGRIFGLTTQALEKNVGGDSVVGNYIFSADTNQKVARLRTEIEELQLKVVKERERYQASTQTFLDEMSAIPLLSIKDSMVLSKDDASYILTLEVPTAIDNVLLQSDVPINLLDVEKNSAVVSFSEPDPQNKNYLLATYRCQINTNRLELKIRTIEGQYGILQAYVTPIIQPKCCQVRQYEIRPLSMHYRIHNFEENRKGESEFKSDNVTTISVLREYLTKEATKKKIKIDISVSVNDESVPHILKLIDPKLRSHSKLVDDISLLDALHELGVNDEETLNSLSPKYRNLLENEKELRAYYSGQPAYLDRLYGIITDLYIDYNKFKSVSAKSKIPKLLAILDNYNYEDLLYFFRPELNI
ncbi:hypothetical protein ILUMI_26683 [Ignelater luminosus]|uniref:Bardet-Biedl syndrome 7 n=1 Tax=Ignelater luminosus TaxID=2038154 RepID=A0A8K0C445_IGNLU|nr:hypothetical protein ILUMI_26683 [Ignelater luminosus]